MRTAHIVPINNKGEIPIYIENQLNYFKKCGINLCIIKFRGNDLSLFRIRKSVKEILRLRNEISTQKVDLLHAHWGSILGFLVILFNKDKPVIVTFRGSDVNKVKKESIVKYLIKYILNLHTIRKSHLNIFVSKKLIKKNFNLISKKNIVIPDGIDLKIFYPTRRDFVRKKLMLEEDIKYIVFHRGGRPIEKNYSLALKVFRDFKKKIKNSELIVIDQNLNQLEIAEIFNAADALLITSHSEGSPNVVREALACRCPVVSVPVGDVKLWIDKSNMGKVTKKKKKLLVQNLLFVINNKLNPSNEYLTEISIEQVGKKLIKIYTEIIEKSLNNIN